MLHADKKAERPVVRITDGALPHVVDAAEQGLIERDAEIFEASAGVV